MLFRSRDMPLGILITLAACALLYASVALVLTGIAHWDTLNNDAPVANALKTLGAFFHGEEHGQRGGEKIALRNAAQLFEIAIDQYRAGDSESVAVLRRLGVSLYDADAEIHKMLGRGGTAVATVEEIGRAHV